MSACIYCIKNKINGKCYVGQTVNYINRKSKHLRDLRNETHCNEHLQRAYNKYGEENFEFSIIEEISDYSIIGEREKYWIEKIGYYNIDKGREGFIPKALRNMSEAHVGNISGHRKITNNEDIYKILAITDFCDGSVRPLESLTPYSRIMIKQLKNRDSYKEISSEYDKLTFEEKLSWLKLGLNWTKLNIWKVNPGSSAPLKNRYILFLIKYTKLTYEKIGELINMSKGGIRKCKKECFSKEREVNTTYTDFEILQILKILLNDNAVLSSIDLEKV